MWHTMIQVYNYECEWPLHVIGLNFSSNLYLLDLWCCGCQKNYVSEGAPDMKFSLRDCHLHDGVHNYYDS